MRKMMSISFVMLAVLVVAAALAGEDGKSLYESKCAMCHGKDGVAKKMAEGSANLNDPQWQKDATLEQIVEVMAAGKGKMPKFQEKLTADEIKLVAEYVKTLK